MLVHTESRNIIFICYHLTDSTTHTLILDKRNLMVNKGQARRNMMTIEDRADGVISDDKDKEKNNSDNSC